ncbi:MATE efflux family protein [methanogenic archaeon mixed culture ISO4-G1]|nr:MATE efflux family protein [methanogenic archaeon mixed culture ISO4-G1]
MGIFAKVDPKEETAIMLGEPRKAIFHMVIPFMISIMVAQVNMLADMAWCSGLGSESISAIQAVNPLYWVIFDVGIGMGLGCNVMISRHIGAGNLDGARNTVSQGVVLSIVSAVILAPFVFLLIDPMMAWMGAEEVADLGASYLTPILICNIAQVMTPTLAGFLRGEGAARRSNHVMMSGTMANIILDPILIYAMNMGVAGAGIATAMANVISTVLMLYLYFSKRTTVPMSFKGYRFDPGCVKDIMHIGAPKLTEMFLMDVLDAINRLFVIQCAGIDGVVLFSLPFRMAMFAVIIHNSFAMSLTPVASANLGAKRPEKSIEAYKLCIRVAITASVVVMAVFLLFAQWIVIPFSVSETMIPLREELATILRVNAFMIPAVGMVFVSNAMLQAMRLPMYSLLISFTRTGLTSLMLGLLCDTSIEIMCAGMVFACFVAAVLAFGITRSKIRQLRKSYECIS